MRDNSINSRRRQRGLFWFLGILILIIVLVVVLTVRAKVSLPYDSIDLCNLAVVDFGGYNSAGTAAIEMDEEAVNAFLLKIKKDYQNATFHNTDPTDEDYIKFKKSLVYSLDKTENLSNGNIIVMSCSYDEDLAKLLKIDVTSTTRQLTVGGLMTVTQLSVNQLFEFLDVTFNGVSPNLTVSMKNNSDNPFIKHMGFEIIDPKEFYRAGDTIRIKGKYSEDMIMETGYIVDATPEECIKEYVISCDSEYITDSRDLPSSIIDEAISAAKGAFVDANEYGVRIFCEAGLVPVYIDKKATFVYGTPEFVSAYFKTVFPENAGKKTCDYNDLDLIYQVTITQADGVSCSAYAAVRFSNIIKNADGSYQYDFSNPTILSESHMSQRVKANVTDAYVTTHEIEKVR